MDNQTLTVGDLKRQLQGLSDDHKLSFSGGLTFYRLKLWTNDEHVIEFNEAQGALDVAFKKRNPNVKVVFIDTTKGGVIDAAVR